MSVASVFRHLLDLQAVRVTGIEFHHAALILFVDVELRRSKLTCSRCHRRFQVGTYDSKVRRWRHLDLGAWAVWLRGLQRRFHCPRCDKIVTEALPWASLKSPFTRDFEDVTTFLAQQANRTVVSRMMRIAWATVGTIIERSVRRHGTPLRLRRLCRIGVDEISYRRHHKYLTIVADHESREVVWGGEGKSGDTLDAFLDAIGAEGRANIELVSLDMAAGYIEKLRERLPNATLVFDPFHVVKLANEALDEVRRSQVRDVKGQPIARAIKKTRWILLKAPENLDSGERDRLAMLATVNRSLYRAYLLKEALRDVYQQPARWARHYLDFWLAWASRSRLPAFVKLARTIRQHRDGILAAIDRGLSNGRLEGINNKIRLLSHRAYGFHSAEALLALVYLCCSGITVPLPSDRRFPINPHTL
jgi:transposase